MTFRIGGKTKVCAIIGDPVEHSVSPAMHNAAFRELGLDAVYVPFRVARTQLPEAIKGVRALRLEGLNVTIPLKVAVMPLLDGLDPLAEAVGAVNTIVNDGGILKGYNTDVDGFRKAMHTAGIKTAGKKVVILGAGGAARAVVFALVDACRSMIVLNRTLERAREVTQKASGSGQARVEALELNKANLAEALKEADVLVNTTNIGMSPDLNKSLVAPELLRSSLSVADIIYNPVQTQLLLDAEKAGCKTTNGLNMLIWQGALALEKWCGKKAPFEVMKRAALEALASR